MNNRTAAIIITILVVLLCGCPGLAALCLGVSSLADYAGGFGLFATDQNTYYGYIFGGGCSGIVLIAITVVICYLVLRKKKETLPPSTDEPIPPTV
jgi:phosphotransferase system  glucose/maltose/N-acetylglucosamine-specific IIC component